MTATNQIAAAPIKPLPTAPPENVEPEKEQPKVAFNNAAPSHEESAEPKPTESVHAETRVVQSNREPEVAAAIPTARPVSPEVRRAEPAPPAEGPQEIAANPETTAAPLSRAKKDRVVNVKRRPEKETIRQTRLADAEEATEAPMPPLPPNRVRAKFIGVGADGNWKFELPSHKVVVVPPPPGG